MYLASKLGIYHVTFLGLRVRYLLLENPNFWAPTISLKICEFFKSMGHGGLIDGGEGSGVVCP
jgi:hypothetical protein